MSEHDEAAALRALVEEQAAVIEELRSRVARLEVGIPVGPAAGGVGGAGGSAAGSTVSVTPPASPVVERVAVPTGRRRLLVRAGAVAAGAVAGGAALVASEASPVAAATNGVFEGDPAVDATALPGTGTAVLGTTTTGTGVAGVATGTSGGAFGVRGSSASTGGAGVAGFASATSGQNAGVFGQCLSPEGAGVAGESLSPDTDGAGVWGRVAGTAGSGVFGAASNPTGTAAGVGGMALSPDGFGVTGIGATALDARSSVTHLRLAPWDDEWPTDPTAAGLPREAGELAYDGVSLWLCVASGTPGTWVQLGGAASAGTLHVLDAAVRAYDSRAGFVPTGVAKGQLTQNQERTIDLTVGGGLPASARAALVNITVTNTSTAGFLKVFRPGSPVPTASAINWSSASTTLANSATVSPAGGEVTLRCGGAGAATDVVVDVVGFYL